MALYRVGFAQPPRHRDAGALLPHHFTLAGLKLCSGSRLRRCSFCGTFPRVSPGRSYRPPCPVMSGLSSKAASPPQLLGLHPPRIAAFQDFRRPSPPHGEREALRDRGAAAPALSASGPTPAITFRGASTRAIRVSGLHRAAADRAPGGRAGGEPLPHAGEYVIQRGLATRVVKQRQLLSPRPGRPQSHGGGHDMLLIRPTTFPRTRTSQLRIGSMASFSG